MLEAVVGGIGMGLVLSTFIGPIFFMMLDLGINGTLRSIFFLALGTFLSDLTAVLILYFLASGFIDQMKELDVLYIAGGGILVYVGLKDLLKKPVILEKHEGKQQSDLKILFKGFVVNGFNPTVFFFWFGAIMLAVNTYGRSTHLVLTHFLSGLLVVFTTDFLKGFSAFQLKRFITEKMLWIINKISGLVIMGFGLKLIFFH